MSPDERVRVRWRFRVLSEKTRVGDEEEEGESVEPEKVIATDTAAVCRFFFWLSNAVQTSLV